MGAALVVLALGQSGGGMTRWLHEHAYDAVVAQVSQETGIAVPVILGLIATESSFNAQATKGESAGRVSVGLTQVLWPGTARALGYEGDQAGLFDPLTNVRLGVKYLGQQYAKTGDWRGAYSAYNGGYNPARAMGLPATKPLTVIIDSETGATRAVAVGEYGNQPNVDRFWANVQYFVGQTGTAVSAGDEAGMGGTMTLVVLAALAAAALALGWVKLR